MKRQVPTSQHPANAYEWLLVVVTCAAAATLSILSSQTYRDITKFEANVQHYFRNKLRDFASLLLGRKAKGINCNNC